MQHSELSLRAKVRRSVLPALAAAALLMLVAGCGGGSSSSSATSTASSSAQASGSGSPGPSSTAAGGSGTPIPTIEGGNPSCPAATLGLISDLTFDKNIGTYSAGDPVKMTLTLTDCGTIDQVLYYATTQRYVFIIVDSNGNEMWRSSDNKVYAQTQGSDTIPAQQSVTYTETWDQTDRSGAQVPDGDYKISAFGVGCGDATQSDCEFGPVRHISVKSVTPSPGP